MKNIDIEYEKKFLKDLIASLKYLKKNDGVKMEQVGRLSTAISQELKCESDELFFAGYYANIGLLMLESITSKQAYLTNKREMELLHHHVYYSAEFVQKRGFIRSAEIIKNHHEKPNGMGYFAIPNKDKDAAIINIADEFVGLSSHNQLRPPIVREMAIKYALEEYQRSSIFTYDEVDIIQKTLTSYYDKISSIGT